MSFPSVIKVVQQFLHGVTSSIISSPASPATNQSQLFRKSDGWYYKDENGTETQAMPEAKSSLPAWIDYDGSYSPIVVGLKAWSTACSSQNLGTTFVPTTGTIYFLRMLPQPGVLTGITMAVTTAATITGAYVGLYDSAGAQLAASTNQSALFSSSTVREQRVPFSSTYTLTSGVVYAAMLFVGTTSPTIYQANMNNAGAVSSLGIIAAPWRAMTLASQTTLPNPSVTWASCTKYTPVNYIAIY